jgi:hypothetical protein
VTRDTRRGLTSVEARAVLTDIERELGANPRRRLSLDWTIEEDGSP